jgi:two-component system, OmpR family, response regulator PrrA
MVSPALRSEPMATVLVLEDDARIRAALVRELRERGHTVAPYAEGLTALAAITESPVDVVVLDLGLPDIDGAQWLRMFRAVSDAPVVVASARDDDPGIVATLDAGADDYLVKPYSMVQLEARLRAVLRRADGDEPVGPLRIGDLVIDARAREVTLAGTPIELTRLEFDLLAELAAHPRVVYTRDRLLEKVWGYQSAVGGKTVDVHVANLRRKLGEGIGIVAVRGVGYKLEPATG